MLYGTNGSGLKGWYVQPSGGSGGVVTEMVSGSAQTLANNTTWAISDPAVIQSGQTVTFPPAPTDAQTIMHSFGGQIKSGVVVTSLQYLANTGQTIIASSLPTQGNAGDAFTFRYKSSNNSWYRIS